jgi:hypothetical protein
VNIIKAAWAQHPTRTALIGSLLAMDGYLAIACRWVHALFWLVVVVGLVTAALTMTFPAVREDRT